MVFEICSLHLIFLAEFSFLNFNYIKTTAINNTSLIEKEKLENHKKIHRKKGNLFLFDGRIYLLRLFTKAIKISFYYFIKGLVVVLSYLQLKQKGCVRVLFRLFQVFLIVSNGLVSFKLKSGVCTTKRFDVRSVDHKISCYKACLKNM